MEPDEDAAARGHGGVRALVLLALAVLLPVVAGITLWLLADQRQLLPGIDGCGWVRDRAAQLECYTGEFEQVVDEEGLDDALVKIDRAAAGSPTLGADCHVAWHPVGERDGAADSGAGREYENIAAETTCQQGYAHGYTIGFLEGRDSSSADLARMVRAECGASSGLNALFNCTHAYGHVIAREHDGDAAAGVRSCEQVDYAALPGADVPSPVPGERPPVLVGAEHQCLYGLYMEVSLMDLAEGGEQLDNCGDAPTEAARKACYAYLPSRVNAITGELEDAASACHDLAPKGDLRDSCVKTLSMGLQDEASCSMLVAAEEQANCRRVIDIRENQGDLLTFADGDPDSFDANVLVSPDPGAEGTAPPPAAPAPGGPPPPG